MLRLSLLRHLFSFLGQLLNKEVVRLVLDGFEPINDIETVIEALDCNGGGWNDLVSELLVHKYGDPAQHNLVLREALALVPVNLLVLLLDLGRLLLTSGLVLSVLYVLNLGSNLFFDPIGHSG
jgi:hypothetical protein